MIAFKQSFWDQIDSQIQFKAHRLLQFKILFMTSQPKGKFKIAHSLQELQDELILTLKDQPLLKNNKQVNEDDDLFENEDLQTINRTKHNAELRKKVKELTDVTTSHLAAKQEGISGILPHYDDHSYKNQEIQVSQNGIINNKKPKPFRNTQNDFLTHQQTQNFKLASQYSQTKIKKTIKKTSQAYQTQNLLSFLNQTAQEATLEDASNKNTEEAIEDVLDSIRKKRILQFNAKRQAQSVDISSIIGPTQQEQLLNKAIINFQKKKQQKKNFILEAIKQQNDEDENHEHQEINNKKQKTVEIELNPISYKGEDKKYVRKQFDVNGIKSGTTSAMFIKLPSERLTQKVIQQKLPQTFKDISPQELQRMKQEVSFMQDKAVGTGLAGTLQYLRQNSLMGKEEQVGRTRDKASVNINDPSDRIKLEYRNANGQLMKPKQAFRYLCATFHGEGPGKNKIQKRKKKQLLELQSKQKLNTDGQLLNMLSEHQRKTNQPYMLLELGKKASKIQ